MSSIIYGRQERKRFFGKVFVAFCTQRKKGDSNIVPSLRCGKCFGVAQLGLSV